MKTFLNEHWKEIEVKLVIFIELRYFQMHDIFNSFCRSYVVLNLAKNDKIKPFKFESKSSILNMTCDRSNKIQVVIEFDLEPEIWPG